MAPVDQLRLELGQSLKKKCSLEREISKLKYCIDVFQKEIVLRSK
jgi:hypothetical protein